MSEWKRVLCSRRLLGLLALLLAANIVLLVAENASRRDFFRLYPSVLQEARAQEPEAALDAIEAELTEIHAQGTLYQWTQSGDDEELREVLAEECAAYFGADFAEQLESGKLTVSREAIMDLYQRQEVLRAVEKQVRYIQDYPAYLDRIHANARQMAGLAIFHRDGSFSGRNIEKTDRDFPTSVELQLDNDYALTMLATDQIGGYSLLIYVLALALSFLEERKRGLWSLVHGAADGRIRLALGRAFILLLGTALGTVVILGGKLLAASRIFGGVGDLGRTVQSMEAFGDVPWVLSAGQFLLFYFALKILGMWLLGLAVWAILQGVNHLPLAIGACGVVLAAEYSAFRLIPDSYAIVFLRYVNLFALVDVPTVALHYLNLNFFGYPVQGFLLTLYLVPFLLLLLFGADLLLAERKKPVSRQNSLLTLVDRSRVPFSRAAGRLRLLGMELYKLLWLQKGVLVLLAMILFVSSVLKAPLPDKSLYDTETAGISASLAGPITRDTIEEIDARIAKYGIWRQDETVLRQLGILETLREKAEQSLAAQDGMWLIDPVPVAALMGVDTPNQYQRQNCVVLLLALVLLLSGVFAAERQSRMTQLLRSTPGGRGRVWRKKIAAVLLLTVAVWLIFEAGELLHIRASYGAFALAAPVQSFDHFAELTLPISLGAAIAMYLLLRLLAMLTAAGVICVISCLCRQINSAILLSSAVLVLPACLSYMRLPGLDALVLVRLFSPLECSWALYAGAAVLCAVLLALCRWLWLRK